ncbi:MAG: hypothetical protein Fur0010_25700 [Bdellovibrio sp.]
MISLEQKMIKYCALFFSIDAKKVDRVQNFHFEIEIKRGHSIEAFSKIDLALLAFLKSQTTVIDCDEVEFQLSDKLISNFTNDTENKIIWVNKELYKIPKPQDSKYMWTYSPSLKNQIMAIFEDFRPCFDYSVDEFSKGHITVQFDFSKIKVNRVFKIS